MPQPAPEPVASDTGDPTTEVLDRLRRIVPEAFKDNKLDLDALAEQLAPVSVETSEERYLFSWHGRSAAFQAALSPTRAALCLATDVPGHVPTSENVFVEGDNLEVLKVLRRSYSGRFKLIYIDPPYNTGKDFVYRDDRRDPLGAYLEATGQTDEAGSLLVANPEGQGRYHSRWLTMMYPRLRAARELLRTDGVFVAAIGDEEVQHLRLLLDDAFGSENRIGTMVWEGGRKNDSKFISAVHDYMLVYAKDAAELKRRDGRWRIRKDGLEDIYRQHASLLRRHRDDYEAITEGLQDWYGGLKRSHPAKRHGEHYKFVDRRGIYRRSDISWPKGGGPRYDVLHPATKLVVKVPQGGWRYPDPTVLQALVAEERIDFGTDETTVPQFKRYLRETEDEVPTSVFYKDRGAATDYLEALMGSRVFDYPKDPDVLAALIEAATTGDDIIFDFFAGSGSTADAVMRQNRKDGQRRRFLIATLPEPLRDKTKTGRNALEAGFTQIAEMAMERVRRSGAKLAAEDGGHDGEDLGFRAYRLSEPLHAPFAVEGDGIEDEDAAMQQMSLAVEPVPANADPERLLVEVLLREGFSLTAPVERVAGLPNALYRVTDRRPGSSSDQVLLVCLDDAVSPSLVEHVPGLAATSGVGSAGSVVLVCRDDAVTDSALANLGLVCGERGWQLKTL